MSFRLVGVNRALARARTAATFGFLIGLLLAGAPVQAQTPGASPERTARDDSRKADFDTSMADNQRRRQQAADSAARIALLTERAQLIADYHSEQSTQHADALQLLAFEYTTTKQWAADAALRARALAIRRSVQGDRASDTLYVARALATSLANDGRPQEAITVLGDILAAWKTDDAGLQQVVGGAVPKGRTVEGQALGMMASRHARLILTHGGDAMAAMTSARLAAAASLSYRRGFGVGVLDEQMLGAAERDPSFYTGEEYAGEWSRLYADALWAAARDQPAAKADALLVLQDVAMGRTSRALARAAAARAAEASGAADLLAQRDQQAVDIAALFKRSETSKVGSAADDQLWNDIVAANEALAALDTRLAQGTPGYFELVRPQLLSAADAQALLAPDEAFVMIVPTEYGTHAMLVTHDAIAWHRSDLTEASVNQHVRRLLWDVGASIDVTPDEDARWSTEGEGDFPFDRGTAWLLYEALLSPFADRLKGKRHLFTAATGSLSSLPLGILVTAPPTGADGDPAALRATPWLADRHALLQLPSLQSLRLLRAVAGRSGDHPQTDMVGFGDPLLDGASAPRGVGGRSRGANRSGGLSVGAGLRFGGGDSPALADPAALRRLARLPGTETELRAMQQLLGADRSRLYLADAATESNLKRGKLGGLSVLFLATHGLVAGEVSGVAEPGLVFTPPTNATAADDGLLTASEIAALDLAARWVILSACNTAAGDGSAGAPGLSGLARAFFFAGAESLLASHWPVRDDVAAVLTVRLFELMKANPALSRAEALQAATKEIRDNAVADPYLKSWAHPSAWAPFSLIGDGIK